MRTAVQSKAAAPTPAPAPAPAAETPLEAYFRRVIESQPVCLTRISSDGTFLAVNDAAMSLLGAERLEQILDTSLLNLVAPQDRDQCRAFLSRITGGDRGSTEVELTGMAGLQHTLQIHAVAIPGSPDSQPAAFCTFRDITEHRRLERALLDASAREEQQASTLASERERLNTALLESREAATRATATAAEQARTAALEAALADAESRHRDLEEQHSARQAQILADFETAQQQFEASLAEQLSKLSEAEGALAGAEARERELAARIAAGEQSSAALVQATAEHGIQAAALQQSIKTLEASLAEATAREQALAAARQAEDAKWQAESEALRQALADLQQTFRSVEQDRDEVIARYDTDRTAWEQRAAAAAEAAQAAQAQAAADLHAARTEAAATLATAQTLAATELQSARAEAQTTIGALRQEIESLESMQAGLVSERDALQQLVADAEVARGALSAQLASAGAERSALESEIRTLERNARGGRLALALAADLEATLASGADRGRHVLGALAASDAVRQAAEAWLAATLEATRLVRRVRHGALDRHSATRVGPVVRGLEPSFGALLSPDIALSVLVGSENAHVDLSADALEQLLLTLVVHRRTMLGGGGQMSLEVADVDLDEECGREHAAPPGTYVLIALHVAGAAVDTGLPTAIFGAPGSVDVWRAAGPGLAGVLQLAHSAGGHAWVTKEGPEAVAFEIYLPRVEPDPDEVTA